MCEYIILEVSRWTSTFMMKTTVFGMNCKANTICRALACHPGEEKPIGYGTAAQTLPERT